MSKNPPEVKISHRDALKPEVLELSASLAKHLKVLPDGKAEFPKDLYMQTLPEGLTEETVKLVHRHDRNFVPAFALALGDAAKPVMKKHAELAEVAAEVPVVDKDYFGFNLQRETKVPNRFAKEGEPQSITRFGAVSVEIGFFGVKNRAQLKHVREVLYEDYAAAFAKA